MPSGHPERATINQRRKLTPGMRRMLGELGNGGTYAECDNGRKNQLRALMDRGFARPPENPGGLWTITDAGRSALEESE